MKCDIKKFFDNIAHDVLRNKLCRIIIDSDVMWLLELIIDSFNADTGEGLPMGNQTSQWFAIYYLDSLDRFFP